MKMQATELSLEGALAAIQQGLSLLAHSLSPDAQRLREAAGYVLEGGGKHLRALLTVSVCHDLANGAAPLAASLKPAVAIEVIHAASLVHDDLPALDNDDMRRGKPSCHKVFGEATAILVGDLLLGAALASLECPELTLDKQARLSGVLSCAWRDLCVGQQLDLESPQDPEVRERMVELKTGTLFGAALASGAIVAGATDNIVRALAEWGVKLGVLFQKLDDVDDGERAASELEVIQGECREALDRLPCISHRSFKATLSVAARALKLSR